jgi:hypothetical protein
MSVHGAECLNFVYAPWTDFAAQRRREIDVFLPANAKKIRCAGPRLPLINIAHNDEPAKKLRRRIIANLSAQRQPESFVILSSRGIA